MKHLILTLPLLALLATLPSCQQHNPQTPTQQPITIDSLLTIAPSHIGDTLTVKGTVRHTCRHSGQRCFIADPNTNSDTKLRIEAPADNNFTPDLIGQQIAAQGILREQRITRHTVDSLLNNLQTQQLSGETPSDHCESSRNNLSAMIAFMDLKQQDYYSNYYLQGLNYQTLTNK